MKTRLYQAHEIQDAAQIINDGGLVAFPTETVFGLGALATDQKAVESVFKAKGRPQDNPLIVHVASLSMVESYVRAIQATEKALIEKFWPGPLTIIFDLKAGSLAPAVTPGGLTLAIRMPDHPQALALIEAVGEGLVGPSANKSGKPSPTKVDHVWQDFNGMIEGILVPQEPLLKVGVESTVVRVHDQVVTILRPGVITKEDLEAAGFLVQEKSASQQLQDPTLISPGVKYRHYSPRQDVYVIQSSDVSLYQAFFESHAHQKIGLLADQSLVTAFSSYPQVVASFAYGQEGDYLAATQNLYAGLRELEASGCDLILAQGFLDQPATHAFMNRLTKAATAIIG